MREHEPRRRFWCEISARASPYRPEAPPCVLPRRLLSGVGINILNINPSDTRPPTRPPSQQMKSNPRSGRKEIARTHEPASPALLGCKSNRGLGSCVRARDRVFSCTTVKYMSAQVQYE